MITAKFNMDLFSRGIRGFVFDLGIAAPKVVAKEMGELEKTLVRLSPKADPKKIKDDIDRRFQLVNIHVQHTHNFCFSHCGAPETLDGMRRQGRKRELAGISMNHLRVSRLKGKIRTKIVA